MNPGEVVLRDKIELTTRGFSVDSVSDSSFKSISYKHEIRVRYGVCYRIKARAAETSVY